MNIRKYNESDAVALREIFRRAIQETASRDYSPQQIAAWAQVDELRWRHKLAHSQVRVAVIGGRPVGFISVIAGYIDLLFVAPDFGRQGIAGALLNQWLIFDLVLDVDASITAKPFFEHHGFQVIRQQNVEARGEWFINYRMRYENKR